MTFSLVGFAPEQVKQGACHRIWGGGGGCRRGLCL